MASSTDLLLAGILIVCGIGVLQLGRIACALEWKNRDTKP